MGKKSVVFVAELSYMEKLEVALKSLCAHKGQWKIYVLNENLPTEWFTLMNRRLEAIDSEILNCRVSAESFKQFSLPSTHIHYATFFRVQEDRVLYLDCDMIFTQDLSPLFEVDLGGFGIGAVVDRPTTTDGFNAGLMVIDTDWWRQHKVTESLFDLTKEHHQNVYGDQGILNLYFNSHGPIISKWVLIRTSMVMEIWNGMMLLKGYQRLFIILPTISLGRPNVSIVSGIFGGFIMPYLGKKSY